MVFKRVMEMEMDGIYGKNDISIHEIIISLGILKKRKFLLQS
jgi:hypothetical protein